MISAISFLPYQKFSFQQVHFKTVSRMFLLPIPVQTYHFYKWRNTQHNIGSPPSRFCFTWVCALHPIDDGLVQVVCRTAGPTLCICWARHICCFDKGDQQKPKNPGLFNFYAHKERGTQKQTASGSPFFHNLMTKFFRFFLFLCFFLLFLRL